MGNLGRAFGDMAKVVSEHPTEIAAALRIVFDTIVLLVDTVTWLAKIWVAAYRNMGDVIGWLIKTFAGFIDFMLGGFAAILDAADMGFGWIPGVGDALGTAKEDFAAFREGVKSDLMAASNAAYGWGEALDKANRKRTLEADISIWQHKLSQARADLKKTTNQKARAKLEADIRDLQRKIRQARGELDSLNGKIAVTYVKTVHTSSFPAQHGGIARAMGGVVGRAATGGIRQNMTMVGEHGPELVNLPPGSHVRSAPDTSRTLAAGGDSRPIEVTLVLDGKVLAREMVEPHREIVRSKGGYQRFYGGR